MISRNGFRLIAVCFYGKIKCICLLISQFVWNELQASTQL